MPVGTIPADNFIKAKTVHIVKLLGKLRITGGGYILSGNRFGIGRIGGYMDWV